MNWRCAGIPNEFVVVVVCLLLLILFGYTYQIRVTVEPNEQKKTTNCCQNGIY